MTEQSLASRLGAKIIPVFAKRVFPQEWVDAGDDRTRLAAVAKKRRAFDGPRPDFVLQRSWGRATTDVAGHQLHLLTPKTGSTGRVLFYCHGGAYVLGPSSLEWLHAAKFAAAIGHDLALYEYPKVPEYDALAIGATTLTAYDAICDRYPADQITIAGLSAGGGLAVSTMLRLHRAGRELPRAAALFSPWLDVTVAHPDAIAKSTTDQMLPLERIRRDGELYAGPMDASDPLVSPRFTRADELAALPPITVTAGDQEILLPECREFVDNLNAAGVSASLHVERFGPHAGVAANTPEGSEVFDLAAADMRTYLASS